MSPKKMGNINAMHIANETPERKILRPLPNKLGHNLGFASNGSGSATEQDCRKIEGHSELFRELEDFEKDLETAVIWLWRVQREMTLIVDGYNAGTEDVDTVIYELTTALEGSFKYLQEAFWIAEVLEDRERARLKMRDRKDFMDLVDTRARSEMTGLDKLAEEGRIEWMISRLLDRMAEIQGWPRMEWPKYGRAEWRDIPARLESASRASIEAERLQNMTDEELAATLQTFEERSRGIRKTITMIHAVRTVRNG